jgi:hypothetical protein
MWLVGQKINDLVEAWTTIAQVPGDDQFGNGQLADALRRQTHGFQALPPCGERLQHSVDVVWWTTGQVFQ